MRQFARTLVPLAFALCVVGCGKPDTADEQPIKISLDQTSCRADDPICVNERFMRRLDEDEKMFGRFDPKLVFGQWRVVAALERRNPPALKDQSPFVQLYELRPIWTGSTVSITPDMITMKPARGAPVTISERSRPGALYPKCTSPEFVTDIRRSASPLEEYINPWQNFGLQYERMARLMFVQCHGSLEYPDDGSGDVAEITVEEAEGLGSLYIQSPELLIAEWGSLQILMTRTNDRSTAASTTSG